MSTQTDNLDREPRRWLPWVFGSSLGCALCAVLAVGGVLIVVGAVAWRFLEQIHVDPDAISVAVEEAVVTTLKEGEAQQRIELLGILEQMGADARPFAPEVVKCTKDDDPKVREAAIRALRAIDPTAADELRHPSGDPMGRGG
jgi:hypothetical protein